VDDAGDPVLFRAGPLTVVEARTAGLRAAVMALRRAVFRRGVAEDDDAHDRSCRHLCVIGAQPGLPLAACRFRLFAGGAALCDSYAAAHYDLSRLCHRPAPAAEIGRLCARPGQSDAQVVRALLVSLAQLVIRDGVGLLFGCTSFDGADPARHAGAIAWLRTHAIGPAGLTPPAYLPAAVPEAEPAPVAVPPLLRAYLGLGARVGPDIVADRDLDTLHVFTALDVAQVPKARARALRRLAAG
jgi:putative hemolysin